ncbi:MAG: prenyltransferase/squalene oxidase repeat-containing protein [Pirellulaceae bacterium]|nr:prenyltransferase/squalene oxidase repeat-containing protein [Pirellulaceae bacterium]
MFESRDIDRPRLVRAFETARKDLLSERNSNGHWTGQLSTSALSTATAISALSAWLRENSNCSASQRLQIQTLIDRAVDWLKHHQNTDGGWGDTPKSYSNISTTMLVVSAFHFCERQNEFAESIARGQHYIDQIGGIAALRRRYGKDKTFAVPILANCAMAGIVDWKEVSALPFEAACVPQKFYHLMQLPVVSYAIPALVAIGQAKFHHDPPRNPFVRLLRKYSVRRSLNVLTKMQPSSGGFLEAIPLTSFVVMGLATTGQAEHPVVTAGIDFLNHSVLSDGSWPIDTNLATWTTTLAINAMAGSGSTSNESPDTTVPAASAATELAMVSCLDWILSCQNQQVHPFTNSPPGGWGWTDLSGAVPDADDTPGALLALSNLMQSGRLSDSQKERVKRASDLGVNWIMKLQNRDDGWPTFCRGWGKLPFDRSGADITAHCMRGIHAWQEHHPQRHRIQQAIRRGLRYLEKTQAEDGSWLPLWFGNQDNPGEENPVYGTSKVLAAYAALNLLETQPAQRGLRWIRDSQNPDGSWGGGESSAVRLIMSENQSYAGSVEETALAVEALMFEPDPMKNRLALKNGIEWLMKAVETNCHRIDSPIGFYFAKLWYHERLYPQIFTVAALGKAVSYLDRGC